MNKQIQLSVCIIVKNEETTLPECLSSVKDMADELIVVDTGSTDQTVKVAKSFGAKVFKKKWQDDFSQVRNFAIEKANGKWILFLDADETIRPGNAERIKSLLDNPMVEGYLFYISTHIPGQEASAPTQSLRLFRNRKEYRYQNRVFERIPEERITSVQDESILILHRPNPSRYKQIQQLKMNLLREEIEHHPEDPYLHYVYGIELLNAEQAEGSIVPLRQALKQVHSFHVFAPHLFKCLVWALMKMKQYDEALEVVVQGIHQFPFYTDLYFLRAQCHKTLKQYQKAITSLEACLQIGEAPVSMIPEPGVGGFRAFHLLGEIHEELGNSELALDFYRKAYESEKSYEEPLYSIGALAKDHPELGTGDEVLLQWLDGENPEHLFTLIDILCLQRDYENALAYIIKVESLVGISEDTTFVKGICYMMKGEGEKAEDLFSLIAKDHPYYSQVLLRRIQNHWFQNQYEEAKILLVELQTNLHHSKQIQEVYWAIHQILSGELPEYHDVGHKGFETLAKFMEHLYWLQQGEKARLLLPWLLQFNHAYLAIKVGELAAVNRDFESMEAIFHNLQDKMAKSELKEAVAKQFVLHSQLNSAERILCLGDPQDLGVYGYMLWSRIWLKKATDLMKMGLRSRKVDQETKNKLSKWMERICREN